MKNQWLMIRQLDRQLKEWHKASQLCGKPRIGWIKTVRKALNMTAEELGHRLGLTRGRINQLERAEVYDAVTLRALKEVANALGCEVVYAIIPKDHSTLEDIIKTRAEQIAEERIVNVAHSMSLEDQSVDSDILRMQKEELTKSLIEHLNKKFWATPDTFSHLAECIDKQMKKNKEEIPLYKNLKNDPSFIKKLAQLQEEKKIDAPDLLNKLKDPQYIRGLTNALVRYQRNNKKQPDLLKKLIEQLQKKK